MSSFPISSFPICRTCSLRTVIPFLPPCISHSPKSTYSPSVSPLSSTSSSSSSATPQPPTYPPAGRLSEEVKYWCVVCSNEVEPANSTANTDDTDTDTDNDPLSSVVLRRHPLLALPRLGVTTLLRQDLESTKRKLAKSQASLRASEARRDQTVATHRDSQRAIKELAETQVTLAIQRRERKQAEDDLVATKAGLKEAEREAEKTLGEAQEGLKEAWRELDEELDRVVELEGEVEKEKEKLAEHLASHNCVRKAPVEPTAAMEAVAGGDVEMEEAGPAEAEPAVVRKGKGWEKEEERKVRGARVKKPVVKTAASERPRRSHRQ